MAPVWTQGRIVLEVSRQIGVDIHILEAVR